MPEEYFASRAYEVNCDLEQLSSLLLALIDQTEAIGEQIEPAHGAKIASDLARIAHDCLTAASGKLALLVV